MAANKISHVPGGLHLASRMISGSAGLWKALGNMETALLGSSLSLDMLEKPVFVTSVARSGTTILTEIISQHPAMACHHYSDFPMTWIPYWWNSLRKNLPLPDSEPQERAHKDRLMITADSPEAVEEVLWMRFFPGAHKIDGEHVLNASTCNAAFEEFYTEHIRKLVKVRGRQRYLAKGNYNITRLEFILKMLPDARFLIPVRDPLQHVASLVKQHRLFSAQAKQDPRVSRQLQLSGHFEFGPDRCPIIVDGARRAHYSAIDDVTWFASQWADIYGFLARSMAQNSQLADACHIVSYEKLCANTEALLTQIFSHIHLDDDAARDIARRYDSRLTQPDYYQTGFTDDEISVIEEITRDVAADF